MNPKDALIQGRGGDYRCKKMLIYGASSLRRKHIRMLYRNSGVLLILDFKRIHRDRWPSSWSFSGHFISIIFCRLVGWSEQGCHVKSINNAQTECSCNHMTHFAVLTQFDTEFGTSISEVGPKTRC